MKPGKAVIFIVSICALISCGIEADYPYMNPVSSVVTTGVTSAQIYISNNYTPPLDEYFRYYAVYYRIYISDIEMTSVTTSGERTAINSVLESDYNYFDPYTSNDTISPSALGSAFGARRYYPLYILNGSSYLSMQDVLRHSGAGAPFSNLTVNNRVDFVFNLDNEGPHMQINYSGSTVQVPLRRSSDGFTVAPDRTFFASADLKDADRISSNTNADINIKSNINPANQKTAYVSMYIAAVGIDSKLTTIFSKLKHIGIFRLPDSQGGNPIVP